MLEWGGGEELSIALVNAILLALWAALPGLFLAYTRQSSVARRTRPEFLLRKSEVIELDRAVVLYKKVRVRLKEICDQDEVPNGFWSALFVSRVDIRQHYVDELEDLEAHAHHLRAMIIRLTRRPLQRLRSWVHIISWKIALGRALAAYVLGLALLIVASHVPEQPAWSAELSTGAKNLLVWYPLDERFFYANAVAAGFAAAAAPVFYLVRWFDLHREYWLEFCTFKELANTNLGQLIDQPHNDPADQDPSQRATSIEVGADKSWAAILGLSDSATIDEVKDAYKALIKQNHPDRVHGMSPAFTKLAEAETKQLNAALQQALIFATSLKSGRRAAPN